MPCVTKSFGTIQLYKPTVQAPVAADMQSVKAVTAAGLDLHFMRSDLTSNV